MSDSDTGDAANELAHQHVDEHDEHGDEHENENDIENVMHDSDTDDTTDDQHDHEDDEHHHDDNEIEQNGTHEEQHQSELNHVDDHEQIHESHEPPADISDIISSDNEQPVVDLAATIVKREHLDDLTEAVAFDEQHNDEPTSPFVVHQQHMDTQTIESSTDSLSSDATSPQSAISTPRDAKVEHESTQQLVISEAIVKVIAPLPPRTFMLAVVTDDGVVDVEIQREYLTSKRLFLGGYRGHKSGRITLHASTQTARRRTKPIVEKSERTTQTVATLNRAQQTLTSVATQMDRRDWCPIDDPTAFKPIYIEPRPAVSAETIEALRDSNARSIQCWLRVCFAHRRKAQLQQARSEAQAIAEAESSAVIAKRQERQQAQIERRMHPQSTADFALLQSELQAWRHHETHRIQSLQLDDEEKDRQLATLLSKEVKLLQTIDRLKLAAAKQRKAREVTERLTAMSSPLEWSNSTLGTKVHVITPNIERAKAMVDLYRALQLSLRVERRAPTTNNEPEEESKVELQSDVVQKGYISWEDRLDILLHVKYTAKEQLHTGSKVCGELVKLIEREEEWMSRRMLSPAIERVNELGHCAIMDGTRTRITSLFLQLINDPTFNPHVAQFPVR